jgi:hypothetical protein
VKPMNTSIVRAFPNTPEYWSGRVCAAWQKAVASIIETGQLLLDAKAAGQNESELKLPFSPPTARKLMAIARHPVICAHVHDLPPSWGTLYELTKLPAETLEAKIRDGTITPDLERKEVARMGAPKIGSNSLPDIETTRSRQQPARDPKPDTPPADPEQSAAERRRPCGAADPDQMTADQTIVAKPADYESERRRMIDQIEHLGVGLSLVAGITPGEAFSLAERGRLVEMTDKAKQVFEWWRGLHELLNPPHTTAALEAAAEQPNVRTITNVDKVLAVLRGAPSSGLYISTIAEGANLSRGAVDAVLTPLLKSGAVLCAPGGIYRLNSAARVA